MSDIADLMSEAIAFRRCKKDLYVQHGERRVITAERYYHLAQCANGLVVLVNDDCELHGLSPEFLAEYFEVDAE